MGKIVGLTMFIQYLMRNHDKPSKFSGYPFTDKPNYHEKWLQYLAVTVDDQIQQDSHHVSCASRRALHCSHPWGKLIAAGMLTGKNTLWRWVHVVLRILISLQSLFVSSGFKHLCFPPSKGLDASTSGARDFPGRACRLDPTSIWRGCSKSPRWVGGTWWDIEFYQAMCLIVFWVKTKQHPDICHKTHEKLLQSVVIITVIFVGMGKKGQGWHRVTYSTYRYI